MQLAIQDEYAPPDRPKPEIFFDQQAGRGTPGGHTWPEYIIDEISKSALFFWLQSPSWLRSAVCRFEYVAARDRIEQAALALCPLGPSDAGEILWQASLCPIRVGKPSDVDWEYLGEQDRAIFQAAWLAVPDHMLDIERMVERDVAIRHDHAVLCQEAAPRMLQVHRSTIERKLGIAYDSLLSYLAHPAPEFNRRWREELRARRRAGTGLGPGRIAGAELTCVSAQRQLADAVSGGSPRRIKSGLSMLLVPDRGGASGFWMTEQPIRGETAERFNGLLPAALHCGTSAAGDAFWSAAAIAAVAERLGRHGLAVPDAAQARAIDAILRQPQEVQLKLGLWGAVSRFWRRDEGGSLRASAEDLPLYLTAGL